MKILHIAPLSPYNVGWSYQDNLLPKYQKKSGHDVRVIVSPFENSANGKIFVGEEDFDLEDGIHVYRRSRKFGNRFLGKFISYTYVYDVIKNFKPDLIMIHSLMTLSVFQAIKYKKNLNPECVIIHDNHLDENIGKKKNKLFTNLFYGYWAIINKFSAKYISKYYGVTPWRMDFIENRFKIKRNKIDLLIMGADVDDINFSERRNYRKQIDDTFNTNDKFLIVTGGKIDQNKKIAELMQAVKFMENTALLVFGKVADNYRNEIEAAKNENTLLVGWLDSEKINGCLLASDLAIFPGQHSVLWEQACACKIPCLFGYWDGMEHVNNGGNSEFIKDVSVEGLKTVIEEYRFTDKYYRMKKVAESDATDIYSYIDIAKKSVETNIQLRG